MKVHHFSILFVIFFLGLFSMEEWKEKYAEKKTFQKACIDVGVERAVDGAARQLATYCDGDLYVDYEKVFESFLTNLYAGLGIMEYTSLQEQILKGIVFFIIVDHEGIYLWHKEKQENEVQQGYCRERIFFDSNIKRTEWMEQQLYIAAKQYGDKTISEEYSFLLPDQDNSLWLRGIEEPCVITFLQGIPILSGCYEKFLFSGAVIHKKYNY